LTTHILQGRRRSLKQRFHVIWEDGLLIAQMMSDHSCKAIIMIPQARL